MRRLPPFEKESAFTCENTASLRDNHYLRTGIFNAGQVTKVKGASWGGAMLLIVEFCAAQVSSREMGSSVLTHIWEN